MAQDSRVNSVSCELRGLGKSLILSDTGISYSLDIQGRDVGEIK